MKAILAAMAGATILAAAPASAQTIKIGIINSYSGFLAQVGDEMEKGLALYFKEYEKTLPPGVKVEFVRRDDGANPDTGKRVAQELITRERVNLLMGIIPSPTAAAIAPLANEAKIPVVLTNAAGSVLTRLSPYFVRTSFTIWQSSMPIGQWTAKQGLKTAMTMVSDFIPGHDGEAGFTRGFQDGGGKVIGSMRVPPANPDFAPFVQRIKDAKPDMAFFWVPANQATQLMKSVRDLGLREAGVKIYATHDLVPDEEIPNIGQVGDGLITTGNFTASADRPATKAFLAAWDKEYGDKAIADFVSVSGWDGAMMIYDMIKATNGKFTSDEAMKFFTNWKTDNSPRGSIRIDPATRDIIQNFYIRRHDWKDGKLVTTEFDVIKDVKDPWKELNPEK
jgi:branched-chain amino acid transport system substrate-binding protein